MVRKWSVLWLVPHRVTIEHLYEITAESINSIDPNRFPA